MRAIIITYGERKLLIEKPEAYHDLVDVARSLFGLGNKVITFHTQPTWYDKECEVTPSGFGLVEAESVIRVSISSMKDGDLTNSVVKKEANGTSGDVLPPVPKKFEHAFRISVEDGTGKLGASQLKVYSTTTVRELRKMIFLTWGFDPDRIRVRMTNGSTRLEDDKATMAEYQVTPETIVRFFCTL